MRSLRGIRNHAACSSGFWSLESTTCLRSHPQEWNSLEKSKPGSTRNPKSEILNPLALNPALHCTLKIAGKTLEFNQHPVLLNPTPTQKKLNTFPRLNRGELPRQASSEAGKASPVQEKLLAAVEKQFSVFQTNQRGRLGTDELPR